MLQNSIQNFILKKNYHKISLFLLLTAGFLNSKEVKALGFFKKDCSSLYKKSVKQLSKPQAKLPLKEERKLFEKLDTCLKEKEAWNLVELLLKNSSRQNLILKQKKIEKKAAELAFYKWKNFEKAIRYYSQLLKRPLDPGERFLFQYQLAKSFFQLEKHSQALIEVEKCFFKGISKQEKRKALFFKLQILLFQKNFSSAESLIKQLLQDFPEDEDFLRETLAVLYESQNKLSPAIEELKKIQQANPFVKTKIKRLEERLKNQP